MNILLSDKGAIIIGAMSSQPEIKWVAGDFKKESGVNSARDNGIVRIILKRVCQGDLFR